MKFQLTKTQCLIIKLITSSKHKCWVVGGAVRDALLEKIPKDLDFVTNMDLQDLIIQCHILGLTVIPDKLALTHGIIKIADLDTKEPIDIAKPRIDIICDGRHATIELAKTIQEDLARRDLTINAMACEIDENGQITEIIDIFNGQEDLASRTIRFVGNPSDRIKEDRLRMLRACRFTALGTDWHLAPETKDAIRENASQIFVVSAERIRDEILKAMGYSNPSLFIRSLYDCKLLSHIIPDVAKCIDMPGGNHHAEFIWDHLLLSLDAACKVSQIKLFRLTALLHDIGKPATAKETNGDFSFHGHEVVGAKLAETWMRSLKFSNADIGYVTKLIRHHMFYFTEDTKDKTIRKWLNKIGKDCWKDLIQLRICDRRGNLAKAGKSDITTALVSLMDRIDKLLSDGSAIFKEDLAINGQDIKALGLKPGPIYKEIFDNMLGIVIVDPSRNTTEWLIEYVRKNYMEKKNV